MNTFKLLLYSLVSFIFLNSCTKELLIDEPTNQPTSQENGIVFNVTDNNGSRSDDELERTVLGELRENPFEISVVQQAQSNIYTNPTTTIEATHVYVKFTPNSMDDILLLEETDEEFYDYPLEYEVITMGDYYQDIVEGTYPTLYAVVLPDFEYPAVQHEIIDELYLTKNDPLLLTECFSLTGNLAGIEDYLPANTGMTIDDLSDDAIGMVPNIPDCGTGCVAILINANPGGAPQWEWKCDCTPPPPPPTNDYGCVVTGNPRYPGGTVLVEDTELGLKGVRRVKVIMKDDWFFEDSDWTDDNGCWSISKKYSGKAWMWVKFKNDRCRIRGTIKQVSASWQWITTAKDYVGKISGPKYNDITTRYWLWTKQGSTLHVYWAAATVNNALHEFHDYAIQDGINTPPNNLDIYVGRNHKSGYALMNTQYYLGGLVGVTLAYSTYYIGPFSYLVGAIGATATVVYLPDVYIGINFLDSDRQKSLAYHEFSHTSHYDQVGYAYWVGLVDETITAGGHGDENTQNRGKLEICESWASYLGSMTYTHRTYGSITSLGGTVFSDWNDRAEHTWNESPNHIPIGIHHDLTDVGEMGISYNHKPPFATTNSISDNVSGININTMFQALNSNTNSINDYKNYIITNSLGNNTSGDINNLFNSY